MEVLKIQVNLLHMSTLRVTQSFGQKIGEQPPPSFGLRLPTINKVRGPPFPSKSKPSL